MPFCRVSRALVRLLAVVAVATPVAAILPAAGFGAAGPWAENDQAAVRLLASGDAVGDGKELQLGLHFRMAPGWKIYWRSPGDAGYPPTTDWSASENLAKAEQSWPVPHRFSLFGLETFGYSDEVVFPISAQAQKSDFPLKLRGEVNYLVCSEICIPHTQTVSLDLPPGKPVRSPEGFLIDSFAAMVPDDGTRAGWSLDSANLTGEMDAPTLEVAVRAGSPFGKPDLLLEGPPGFSFAKPEIEVREDGRLAILRTAIGKSLSAEGVIEGKRLTITIVDGSRGLEQETVARFENPAGGGYRDGDGFELSVLMPILGLALLGGLILNLMPCVLPVLSIKLLSVVEQGGRSRREIRAGFLASAAGIVTSFLVLAATAVTLKLGGASVGWGIQFQQPLFLVAITLVVALFAFNLFGFFEIGLPGWLTNRLGRPVPRLDNEASAGRRLAGHFGSGVFATLLATPCSAPFLGTAVSFALARGAPEIFLIFLMLGLGLALPYLLVAALPGLARSLPRPGAWMITLRRILGLALLATAVWLLSVLAKQVGLPAVAIATTLLTALGGVLWLGRISALRRGVLTTIAFVLAGGLFILPTGFAETPAPRLAEEQWLRLDVESIAGFVEQGDLVFVDVTADWCITCQVNKKLVLENKIVLEVLNRDGMRAMRGDWTSPDPAISAYLASFDRYGIPFNAIYGPAAPDGIALPELLTTEAVLNAVERASGESARLAGGEATGQSR